MEQNLYEGKVRYQDKQCQCLLLKNHAGVQDQHESVLKQKLSSLKSFLSLLLEYAEHVHMETKKTRKNESFECIV